MPPVVLSGRKPLVRMRVRGAFFNKCNTCLANNMGLLHKVLTFAKDLGLTTSVSGRVTVAFAVVVTFTLGVRVSTIIFGPTMVMTTISGMTPEVEQLAIKTYDFSARDPSLFPSPIKRNSCNNSSTPVEACSPKRTRFLEDTGSKALTHLFQLPDIFHLIYRAPQRNFLMLWPTRT